MLKSNPGIDSLCGSAKLICQQIYKLVSSNEDGASFYRLDMKGKLSAVCLTPPGMQRDVVMVKPILFTQTEWHMPPMEWRWGLWSQGT